MHLLKYPWNEKSFSPKFKHSASQMLLQTWTLTFFLDSDSWLSEMWACDLAAQSLWFPEDWFHRNILTSVSSVSQFYPMETENSIFYQSFQEQAAFLFTVFPKWKHWQNQSIKTANNWWYFKNACSSGSFWVIVEKFCLSIPKTRADLGTVLALIRI